MLFPKLYNAMSTAVREARVPQSVAPQLVCPRHQAPGLLAPMRPAPKLRAPARSIFGLVPKNQYENNNLPKKFQLGYALRHHWEIIPLFLVICFDVFIVLGIAVYTALKHKVDTQFTLHNWNCISRNMDLRNPTIHKNWTIYQRYEPWPEMQAVLDKMKEAEHRNKKRLEFCDTP